MMVGQDQRLASLATMLSDASTALQKLGSEPLAVASARDKFNDANSDDYWCAVQIGQAHWEQSQFFGSARRGDYGTLRERGQMLLPPEDFASAAANVPDIEAGRTILKGLDDPGWHDRAAECLDIPPSGTILALVVQFDQVWLHCSEPRGGYPDKLFALADGGLRFCGESGDRFDERVGKAELVRCEHMNSEALARLSETARAHFGFKIVDKAAARQLASLLLPISAQMRGLVGEKTPFAAKIGTDWQKQKYPWIRGEYLLREFAIGDHYYDSNYYKLLKSAAERNANAAERAQSLELFPLRQLNDFSRSIDHDEIRRSFERATGVDTFDYGDLLVLADPVLTRVGRFSERSKKTYVLYRRSLYRVEKSGLTPIARTKEGYDGVDPDLNQWIQRLDAVFRQKSKRLY